MSSLDRTGRLGRLAIIGRPNVGKSTLFNILTNSRKAIVRNQPGVTRDVQIEPGEWRGINFEVMDTGGLTEADDVFSKLIREHVPAWIRTADAIVFVMDAKSGLCPEVRDVYRLLIQMKKPLLMVINKVDQDHNEAQVMAEFYELEGELVGASFERRRGLVEILEWALPHLDKPMEEVGEPVLTMAVLGKPNAGKSSFCNKLVGDNRFMVSDIAGTTVDAVEAEFERDGRKYAIVDTAGLRRAARRVDPVEIFSAFKSRDAQGKSDIVLLMIDGLIGATEQDAKIAEMVIECHRGLIVVVNKTDLGEAQIPEFRKTVREQIATTFHFFPDVPISFISAKTGAGMDKLFQQLQEVWAKLNFRISTSKLNDFFFDVIRRAPAPVDGSRDVKFFYLTQTKQRPPSFIAFANLPDGVSPSYRRFLAKNIKTEFGLDGIPIRIFAMRASGKERRYTDKAPSTAEEKGRH